MECDMVKLIGRIILGVALGVIVALMIGALPGARANDDGRYANSPLKAWFDHLASGKGLCCSFADGVSIEDVGDTQGNSYRVRIKGEWMVVPDAAVVNEPNKFGSAVVWPYTDGSGQTQIRCFIPGGGV